MTPDPAGPQQNSPAARGWQNSRLLPAIVLPLVIALHLFSVLQLHPAKLFGLQQDDALYFSSAKALAEGRGYILPSLPGAPAATKYPILYPWFLSWVWRLNPSFPANLPLAFTLNYFFAIAAILLSYLFCRLPLHLPRLASLAIAAFCSLHPAFIFYSARLMTDVPFTALALGFLLFAYKASPAAPARNSSELNPELKWAILAGILADLCVLMRLAGAAFIAGFLLVLLLRKYWKIAAVFLASCTPGIFYFVYQGWLRVPSAPPAAFSESLPGWQQTWYYFTSYTSFRHLDSPNLSSAITLGSNQLLYFVSSVAGYFVSPLADSHIALWLVSSLVFAALLLAGALRMVRNANLIQLVAVFSLYLILLLGWDYVEWTRFLFPFYPLVLVLILAEAWRCYSLLRTPGTDWIGKSLLAAMLVCAAGLVAVTGWNYFVSAGDSFAAVTEHRDASAAEQRAAFEWIRDHTDPSDVLITTEYATTYLYSGRQAINFTVPLPLGVYDKAVLQRDLDHMPDVGNALHARYWVIADYDPQTQLRAFERPLRERLSEWERSLPRVFKTPKGAIRIYSLQKTRP